MKATATHHFEDRAVAETFGECYARIMISSILNLVAALTA